MAFGTKHFGVGALKINRFMDTYADHIKNAIES